MKPFAILIESSHELAVMVCRTLEGLRYHVAIAATHVDGAAAARLTGNVDLAVMAPPADGGHSDGDYLRDLRLQRPDLPMVIMLAHPLEVPPGIPETAVSVVKPFTAFELERAVAAANRRQLTVPFFLNERAAAAEGSG